MLKMFKSMDPESITYIKMYSSFTDEITEAGFAYVLMPASPQRSLVCLQSIQFVFNACGDVTQLGIFYNGKERDIQKKVCNTMSGLVSLKLRHGAGCELCTFDENRNFFNLQIDSSNDSSGFLTDIIDLLKEEYLMKPDFVLDLKLQLLDKNFLEQEFIRLRGKTPEPRSACIIC
ncbi:hypothetical protein [Legionella quateirensis]|uniref:Uncharacterized protein n=1 Tax=Legionella quateirensis TaxID=45072 RepID=A0A378KSE8_9GAMM|nr:hypothetical protein [Legionella quateirensis]KTD52863.1 hypothetical protein Lqua_0696 [Legionella quateirensis]STY16407.1 Uncharacterised protein [Legionella quateirensis]